MEETVECLECGREFKAITNTHLKSHGMTLDQYRKKYPGVQIISEFTVAKRVTSLLAVNMSQRMYQHYEDHPETIERMKGPRPHTRGENNPAKWDSTRKKISDAAKGVSKSPAHKAALREAWKTRPPTTDETKLKMAKTWEGRYVGKDNPNWQGGISFEPYCQEFNYKLKEQIRNQYNNCDYFSGLPDYICNLVRKGQVEKLCIHHIDRNKMQGCDGVEWNLIPLSRVNHAKVHGNQQFWERLICYALEYDETYYDEEIIDIFTN